MRITHNEYLFALRTIIAATLRPISSFAYSGGPRYIRSMPHMIAKDNLLAPECGVWVHLENVREVDYIYQLGYNEFKDMRLVRVEATCLCGEYTRQDAVSELCLGEYGDVDTAVNLSGITYMRSFIEPESGDS